jgi:hypothetical protein
MKRLFQAHALERREVDVQYRVSEPAEPQVAPPSVACSAGSFVAMEGGFRANADLDDEENGYSIGGRLRALDP